jgi:excisionase family DNA binding protein
MLPDPPFTPKMLAQRWGCSRQYIHTLLQQGRLKSFRLGERLVRISAEEVKRWEEQSSIAQTETTEIAAGGASKRRERTAGEAAFASVWVYGRRKRQTI